PTKPLQFVDSKDMFECAKKSLGLLNANIDPNSKIYELSTGEQQLVEIARALSHDIGVLILDEPTASLSETEASQLLDIVKDLREQGLAILYVSHRLEEVFELADTITVIRDGNVVGTRSKEEVSSSDIVKMMVGRDVELKKRNTAARKGNKVLEVKGLCRKGIIEDIDFELYEGEILGLGGLVGAGRTEVARAIFGLDSIDSGEIKIKDKVVKIVNPRIAMKYGINLVPEDRKSQGLVLVRSVKENITLTVLSKLSRFGWMDKSSVLEMVNGYKDQLRIKTQSVDAPVLSLSGGNQQKVVLARGLATNPRILILDEPTRGVDVGAREEIQRLIEELVSEGLAILIISSDILELLAMSDRVIVLRQGKQVAELSKEEATKEEVLQFATGSK
ncbi:MAG: sugar ABC transporter ATP-binding protein, partial [Ruminiclostridium sp.]